MKRSRSIKLVLIGTLSVGALSGCGPSDSSRAPITTGSVYTNNYFVSGVGYYHAPFRAWYPLPYNHFDPPTQRYFYGGQWAARPDQNFTNISAPTPAVAQSAQAQRTDIPRQGFGSTSHHHSTWS